MASAMLEALGGAANVRELGTCTTRLRLIVVDDKLVKRTVQTASVTDGLAQREAIAGSTTKLAMGSNVGMFPPGCLSTL